MPYSLDTPFTNVDLDDVAEVAATVLTRPGHEGVTYDLAGPEVLSVREQAHVAADVLGHPVEAVRVELAEWVGRTRRLAPAAGADDLLAMFAAYDRGGLVGDPPPCAGLLGREPAFVGAGRSSAEQDSTTREFTVPTTGRASARALSGTAYGAVHVVPPLRAHPTDNPRPLPLSGIDEESCL